MDESVGENEAFVENVMAELDAFHVTEKSKQRHLSGDGDGNWQRHSQGAQSQESDPKDTSQSHGRVLRAPLQSAFPKTSYVSANSRITSNMQSNNQHSITRDHSNAQDSTEAESSAEGIGETGASTAVNGSLASGSRMAALQRAGSPLLKYVHPQSQSVVGRLTRSDAIPGSSPGQSESMVSRLTRPGTITRSSAGQSDTKDSQDGSISAKKQSETSSAGSSISASNSSSTEAKRPLSALLFRRPQSPLVSGRQSPLVFSKTQEQGSSSNPTSPVNKEAEISPPSGDSLQQQQQNREAIRNKLRHNSFRLNDLLKKRPFVKARDQSTERTLDKMGSSLEARDSAPGSESIAPEACSDDMSANVEQYETERFEAESLVSKVRSRSYFRSRTGNASNASSVISFRSKPVSVSDAKPNDLTDGKEVDSLVSWPDSMSTSVSDSQLKFSTSDFDSKFSDQSDSIPAQKSLESLYSKASMSVGSGDMSQGTDTSHSQEQEFVYNSMSDGEMITSQDHLASGDASIGYSNQNIFNLEKPKNANLVFDSEDMGKERPITEVQESPALLASSFQKLAELTSKNSRSKSGERQPRSRLASAPGICLDTEPHTSPRTPRLMRGTKSHDATPDQELLQQNSGVKRTCAVTDLDKAMQDRDKQKLHALFKESSKDFEDKQILSSTPASPNIPITPDREEETDIDASPNEKVATKCIRSPKVFKEVKAIDETRRNLTKNVAAAKHYKPNVNLEDAVKWPLDVPGKLDIRKMEVFEGQMLLNWLTSAIDSSHYLRLVLTKHDLNVVACQFCTCLIAAGIIKQIETKEKEEVFKTDCMYYWTRTQGSSQTIQDVGKLSPNWPPAQPVESSEPTKQGLKYTEAEHQGAMVTLRHEYQEEKEKMQRELQHMLDKAREEYERRIQEYAEKTVQLQREVEKYKVLAGIDELTEHALSDAKEAGIEAGFGPEYNGFITPSSEFPYRERMMVVTATPQSTPSTSQYHTPAATPECVTDPFNSFDDTSSSEYLFDGVSTPEELRSEAPTPPPPPPPPLPGGPPPPPPPPSITPVRRASLRPVISPKSPMKPLFWQRIQVHEIKTPMNKEYTNARLVWEELVEPDINVDEFDDMFSRPAQETCKKLTIRSKSVAKQVAKIIEPKKSQTVGIFLSSLRMEMSEVEHAILTFDTSVLNEEKLRHIYEHRGTEEEIQKIKEHVNKNPDIHLDKPEQFLYDLHQIPDCSERLFCFIFQEAFQDSISVIEDKLTNIRMTCDMLMKSICIKRLLGLVLAMGNYMNGGHKARGQADGFGIDILPKLKDVKSKDNGINLLQYLVQMYVRKYERDDAGTDKAKLPIPDPSDLNQGSQVNFEEITKEMKRIQNDFDAAEERASKVIKAASEQYLHPFKEIMSTFFIKGKQKMKEQEENLKSASKIFHETVIFFCVKPKPGFNVVTAEHFFSLWASFCKDFKDIWKREQQRIIKQRIKEAEQKVKRIQEGKEKQAVRTRRRERGGLKDRLASKGML
ncbi:hypothetical protein CHS0354_009737 [Potamilus streckersoni]|uniref:FH2 domain-containing protein n=1 Tax=Potamilus streckersoni TaxID=2493646 RepID=A0AAE0VL21_9BIVA|nr:hypothetical protein CHS0354_009737 [Potamilus streckersoni]